MKREILKLTKELEERMLYLLQRYDIANDNEEREYYTGKYCEVKEIYQKLKEMVKDDN